MQAGKKVRADPVRTDWVGEFPCRGQEAPQRALVLVSKNGRVCRQTSSLLRLSSCRPSGLPCQADLKVCPASGTIFDTF